MRPLPNNILDRQPLLPRLGNQRIQLAIPRPRLPRPRAPRREHVFDLLERLAARLRVGEVELRGAEEAHGAEDHEHLPRDVGEARRDVQTECEVEEPVADRGDAHAGGAGLEGPDFGGVDPADGGEGEGVDDYH